MGKHSHSHSHSHSHKDHDKKRRKRRHGHEKHRKRDSSSSSSSSSDEELQWEEKVVETTSSTTPAFNENTTTNLISNIDNHPNETLNTEKKENVLQEPANVPVPNVYICIDFFNIVI